MAAAVGDVNETWTLVVAAVVVELAAAVAELRTDEAEDSAELRAAETELTAEVALAVADEALLSMLLMTLLREALTDETLELMLEAMLALVALMDAELVMEDDEAEEVVVALLQDDARMAVKEMDVQSTGVELPKRPWTTPPALKQKVAEPPTKAELSQTKPLLRPKVVVIDPTEVPAMKSI